MFPAYFETTNIKAPAGFIHGYDIASVLIAATNKVTLTQDAQTNRTAIKVALESIDKPVRGLVKTYQKPYAPFSDDNFDAREALGSKDYCMAMYDEKDAVKLLPNSI